MASYDFECATHGVVTVRMQMSAVTPAVPCPTCAAPARRRYTIPHVRFGDTTARRLIAATEKSAHEPEVVSAPLGTPLRRDRRPLADPRTARLPRP